jgi:predicted metal-dependent hydrolase
MIRQERLIQATPIQCSIHFEQRNSFVMRYRNFLLEVKVPVHASLKDIDRWIESKERWIIKQHRIQQQLHTKENEMWFLNQKVPLFYTQSHFFQVKAYTGGIAITYPFTMSKQEALAKAEVQLAQEIILPIMRQAMHLTGLHPKVINLKTMTRSWGRCSSNGHISLNKKLLSCDPRFIEYVCVHELAHLKHMNHSKRFYALVESFLPDYKQRKKLSPYTLQLG